MVCLYSMWLVWVWVVCMVGFFEVLRIWNWILVLLVVVVIVLFRVLILCIRCFLLMLLIDGLQFIVFSVLRLCVSSSVCVFICVVVSVVLVLVWLLLIMMMLKWVGQSMEEVLLWCSIGSWILCQVVEKIQVFIGVLFCILNLSKLLKMSMS